MTEEWTHDAAPDATVDQNPAPAEAVAGNTAGDTAGNTAVDEVLASLGALDDAPVSEHVAVFESAHERLRGALSGAGDAPA